MMNNFRKLSVLLTLLIVVSCYNDGLDTMDSSLLVGENNNELKDVSYLKSEFSSALAKVLAENRGMRELIKEEALKQFDYDYDVLYMLVKDQKAGGNETLEELLLKYMNKDDLFSLIQEIPTLTIFVPSLPEESFSAEIWDIEQEVPFVAYKNEENTVLYVDSEGVVNAFEYDEVPVFPIVVVKPSERVVLQNASTRSSNSSTVLQAGNGMNFVFGFNEFDNVTSSKAKTRASASATEIPDPYKKNYDAKRFADLNGIWQRDYIYYNISTKDGNGVFQRNISECIYSIELLGDPSNMYRIIADQEDDPMHRDESIDPAFLRRHNIEGSVCWYKGNFEFIVKVYISNKQLSVNEIIKAISVKPDNLFGLQLQQNGRKPARIVGVSKLYKYYLPEPLPLFDWNIENYSASIKISIEESDSQQTTQEAVETTNTFATNFEFNPVFGEVVKVGAKLGGSASTTHKVSTTLTTYLNSDQLGDVIINFGDDVVIKNEMDSVGFTSSSSSSSTRRGEEAGPNVAIYKPALNPRYNSGYTKVVFSKKNCHLSPNTRQCIHKQIFER